MGYLSDDLEGQLLQLTRICKRSQFARVIINKLWHSCRGSLRNGGGSIAGVAAMKATIWHNPACGTSRKTLAILENLSRVDVTVVEYLKTPPSVEKLAQLYRDAGITPQQGLRLRGTDAAERGLPEANDAAVLAAMVADPILIERPLVETDKGVRLCRPQDIVLEIL
jgi:arsenate reductase